MLHSDLDAFKDWFADYSRAFITDNSRDSRNIDLKVRHTAFVCENALLIGREEQWDERHALVAETAALFHDVGRFLQYSRYKTFRDNLSVNHGRLGAEILRENGVLKQIPSYEQELIINTVQFHNAFEIPPFEDRMKILLLQLIRDADKLDIWRVFAEYYLCPEDEQASAVGLGLPDLPEYSGAVLSCLHEKKLATLSGLKTQNDFKLMQLSWVYDLHFRHSFRLLTERSLIEKIASTLPQTEEIATALATIQTFVSEKSGAEMGGVYGSHH